MWLVTSAIAALAATAAWTKASKEYKLGNLALMLWGLTILVLVDHILGYEGGAFIEMETDGMIQDGTVLGIVMLLPVFLIWELQLITSKISKKSAKEVA